MNKKREDGEIYSDLTDVDLGVEIAKVISQSFIAIKTNKISNSFAIKNKH